MTSRLCLPFILSIVYDYVGEKSNQNDVFYVIGGHTSDAVRKIYTSLKNRKYENSNY
ncbi:hypothetical protein M139_3161 [Bacteroides fragilis str. S23L24]|nr:hypothetical protein M139_3161 [Bacteroides fragilis str. S23L24]EYE43682.1 hypothetical protein M138_3071 [Bacteroides fragilis str. S23L17]